MIVVNAPNSYIHPVITRLYCVHLMNRYFSTISVPVSVVIVTFLSDFSGPENWILLSI